MLLNPRSEKIKSTKSKIWNKKFNLGRIPEKLLDRLVAGIIGGYVLGRQFNDIRGRFILCRDEYEEEIEYFRKKAERRHLIREFRQRRLIKEKKAGDRILCYLTEKGAAELLRYNILHCDKLLANGRVCVVVFDIPESQNHARELFRRFLKKAGFMYLQQSVWITQKDLLDDLCNFIKSIQTEHWVNLFIADAIIMEPSKSKRLKINFKNA